MDVSLHVHKMGADVYPSLNIYFTNTNHYTYIIAGQHKSMIKVHNKYDLG